MKRLRPVRSTCQVPVAQSVIVRPPILNVLAAVLIATLSTPVFAASPPSDGDKKKAIAASIIAKESLVAGNYKEAAKLYDRAAAHDPTEPGYLYSAARAKQKAGLLKEAEADYANVLKYKALSAKLAEKTRQHLLEVRSARAAKLVGDLEAKKRKMEADDKAKKQPAKSPAPVKQPHTLPSSTPMLTYAALGGGLIVGAAGAVLYGIASGRQSDVEAKYPTDDTPPKITYDEAKTELQGVANMQTAAAVLGGVGVLGVGAGLYLLLTDEKPEKQAFSLVPSFSGRGLSVTVRY